MTAKNLESSASKLRALVLYVLGKQSMDRVKLGNVLFLIDLEAYRKLGAAITGVTYVKRPWGAEPRNFGHILGAMRRHRQIEPDVSSEEETPDPA